MSDSVYDVVVSKDLEDLVPVFIGNRHKELDVLRAAVAAGDFEQLRQIGHRMKGVGHSYGFAKVSELGKQIEDAAKTSAIDAARACVEDYTDYLSKVTVRYD